MDHTSAIIVAGNADAGGETEMDFRSPTRLVQNARCGLVMALLYTRSPPKFSSEGAHAVRRTQPRIIRAGRIKRSST